MTNPLTEMVSTLMSQSSLGFDGFNRRKEDINVPTERRTRVQSNLANQFDDLCKVCGVAGECTCSDEQFYADRATWLSEGAP